MAPVTETNKTAMDCDNDGAANDKTGGKRQAAAAPLEAPASSRARPGYEPLSGPPTGFVSHTKPTPIQHPPEEGEIESLFGGSTHPSEGVTPHGPRTESATARKP